MNKPQLVSFFVYRRQSRDRFRINIKPTEHCFDSNMYLYIQKKHLFIKVSPNNTFSHVYMAFDLDKFPSTSVNVSIKLT